VAGEAFIDVGAALSRERAHRRRGKACGVTGFGGKQVLLGGDVGAGKPRDPVAESGAEPPLGLLIVRGRGDEQRAVRDVVQGGGEDQFVVGAVGHGARRGLQCVVELVDGFLVPDSAQ
jgi:hypothetical protein